MDVNIAIQNQAKNDLKMYLKESTAQRQHLIDSYDRFLWFFFDWQEVIDSSTAQIQRSNKHVLDKAHGEIARLQVFICVYCLTFVCIQFLVGLQSLGGDI